MTTDVARKYKEGSRNLRYKNGVQAVNLPETFKRFGVDLTKDGGKVIG